VGRETCSSLAKHNPKRLFIAARNGKGAGAVINDIKRMAPEVEVVFVECDLASFWSVKEAAGRISSSTDRLDVLFCNALEFRCFPWNDVR